MTVGTINIEFTYFIIESQPGLLSYQSMYEISKKSQRKYSINAEQFERSKTWIVKLSFKGQNQHHSGRRASYYTYQS